MQKQIYIPKPCSENWNLMTPKDQGRFCDKCNETVTDFTQFTNQEIISYLRKQRSPICGRMRKDQLSNNPAKTLTTKLKIFIYALALIFLPFLPFKSFAQSLTLEIPSHFKAQVQSTIKLGLPKSYVRLFKNNQFVAATWTDSNGFFQFENLKGRYNAIITNKNYKKKVIKIRATKKNLIIRMTAPICKEEKLHIEKDIETIREESYSDDNDSIFGGRIESSHYNCGQEE